MIQRDSSVISRFLNADEPARGVSPHDPPTTAIRAGKLLFHEIAACLKTGVSFGLKSTLSGTIHVYLPNQAKALRYQIEIHYLWLPAPKLAIRPIAQRVISR